MRPTVYVLNQKFSKCYFNDYLRQQVARYVATVVFRYKILSAAVCMLFED